MEDIFKTDDVHANMFEEQMCDKFAEILTGNRYDRLWWRKQLIEQYPQSTSILTLGDGYVKPDFILEDGSVSPESEFSLRTTDSDQLLSESQCPQSCELDSQGRIPLSSRWLL